MGEHGTGGDGPPSGGEPGGGLGSLRSSVVASTSFDAPGPEPDNEHVAHVYESREQQFAASAPFLAEGLDRGEQCLYVFEDNSRETVRDALDAGGVDVAAARDSGDLRLLSTGEYLPPDGFDPDAQLRSLGNAITAGLSDHLHVRVVVEMTCFLEDGDPVAGLVPYERRYNGVSTELDATAICQYDRRQFPDPVLREVVRAHPHLVAGDAYSQNLFYDPASAGDGVDRGSIDVDLMLATLSDLAEAETELRRQNDRLEAFASLVSHELRNPLNVAQGRLSMASETGSAEHLAAVSRAHDRMETLIDDLLTLARVGEQVYDPGPVDLAEVVGVAWDSVPSERATLVADTTAVVRADRDRLTQLLENLLRNAVTHGRTAPDGDPASGTAGDGGPSVTVTVGDLPDGDGFFVADDGPGIPPEERDRVFDHGYSTADGGTGFGLGIVRDVAEAHEWTVTVTASADGGARFDVADVTRVDSRSG